MYKIKCVSICACMRYKSGEMNYLHAYIFFSLYFGVGWGGGLQISFFFNTHTHKKNFLLLFLVQLADIYG